MTDTFGGVMAQRRRPGLKWHRMVDFATAEAYARRHGRSRLRRSRPVAAGLLTACGQDLGGLASEQAVFEDRPPPEAQCGKCWG